MRAVDPRELELSSVEVKAEQHFARVWFAEAHTSIGDAKPTAAEHRLCAKIHARALRRRVGIEPQVRWSAILTGKAAEQSVSSGELEGRRFRAREIDRVHRAMLIRCIRLLRGRRGALAKWPVVAARRGRSQSPAPALPDG